MVYNWYFIFHINEFNGDLFGLPLVYSKTRTYNLDGIGEKKIISGKAAYYYIVYEGVHLGFNASSVLNEDRVFEFGGYAMYQKNGNFYLGVPQ